MRPNTAAGYTHRVADFKEPVHHTGGKLTIHTSGGRYQLGYTHQSAKRAALVELVAIKGNPVAIVPFGGVNLNPDPDPPQLMTMLPSDEEAMFGRRCPKCESYFRTKHVTTTYCPYCDVRVPWRDFFTKDQREFVRRQYDSILAALAGPDGDTTLDFDAELAELTRSDRWVYSEEKQQTHIKCSNSECGMEFDVLGEYVRCPNCATSTARSVVTRRLAELSSDFERDAKDIPKDQVEQRQRRWRHYVPAVISEFEVLGREIAGALALIPCTPGRRKAIKELSFQHPLTTAKRLNEWFELDLLYHLGQEECGFLDRMFNRRHLFAHCGGSIRSIWIRLAIRPFASTKWFESIAGR